jgi:hypothetical protein
VTRQQLSERNQNQVSGRIGPVERGNGAGFGLGNSVYDKDTLLNERDEQRQKTHNGTT